MPSLGFRNVLKRREETRKKRRRRRGEEEEEEERRQSRRRRNKMYRHLSVSISTSSGLQDSSDSTTSDFCGRKKEESRQQVPLTASM